MIRKIDALIQYYSHRDTDQLTDEQWAILAKNIEWARDQERNKSVQDIGKLFG